MSSSVLDAKHFHDEAAAFAYLESRIWPNGPICPHCAGSERISKMKGKSTRVGLYKCYRCRKPFRATVGTVFEASHVPVRLWLQAVHLMAASKKGVSSNQLHRILGVTLKTAWFMSHRIREAMRVLGMEPMGSGGGVVEVDETYTGKSIFPNVGAGTQHKLVVLTLVERGGEARSFHIGRADRRTIEPIVEANLAKEAKVASDDAGYYRGLKEKGFDHASVSHRRGEYARGEVHSNTVEGYFSVFKRGMKGVYQHCSEKHLHRYLAEFDFRYSNRVRLGVDDTERAARALSGIVGKRLTYRATDR
ncbi:MAG: IS1595 family transposase [Hyphomicrobium sp.]